MEVLQQSEDGWTWAKESSYILREEEHQQHHKPEAQCQVRSPLPSAWFCPRFFPPRAFKSLRKCSFINKYEKKTQTSLKQTDLFAAMSSETLNASQFSSFSSCPTCWYTQWKLKKCAQTAGVRGKLRTEDGSTSAQRFLDRTESTNMETLALPSTSACQLESTTQILGDAGEVRLKR